MDILIPAALVAAALVVLAQGLFAIYLMCYSWEHPERLEASRGPRELIPSDVSFTALVPARHEAAVIYETIRRIWAADYPRRVAGQSAEEHRAAKERLLEIVVICHEDDESTIREAERAAREIGSPAVRVATFGGGPVNKPRGLNVGVRASSHDVVAVFDAEDDVQPDIFSVVATVMERDGAGIVQGPVQLMNFRDRWFGIHNCLEYYFWYKSRLHFHAASGMIPLGGNTVFVRRDLLERVHGWDEASLTEDADIGVRLSVIGEPIRVVYDAAVATREETPLDVAAFVRQRTRWHQGYLQLLRKGDWRHLPRLRQRVLAAYTFGAPFIQLPMFVLWPIALLAGLLAHVSAPVALVTMLPFYALLFQFLVTLVGAGMFTREYGQRLPLSSVVVLAVTFLPFEWLLLWSSVRAMGRELAERRDWEKTAHLGAHREARETAVPSLDLSVPPP